MLAAPLPKTETAQDWQLRYEQSGVPFHSSRRRKLLGIGTERCRKNQTDASSRVHKLLDTEAKMPLSVPPIDAFAAIPTIAIKDPIIAYSIAVTPRSCAIRVDRNVRMSVVPKRRRHCDREAGSRSNAVKARFDFKDLIRATALSSETKHSQTPIAADPVRVASNGVGDV